MITSFSKYSEAFKELLKEVFNGPVIMEQPDTAFQYAVKNTDDKVKFPFISFYPDSNIMLDKKNNSMPSYDIGIKYENPMTIYKDDGTVDKTNNRLAKNVQFLYIIIGVQIDIWATSRLEAEEVTQELLFWLHHNQQVHTKYRDDNLYFSFELGDEVVDNTDLVSYSTNGKMYRYTYGIRIHATLLRSENYFTVLHPNIGVEELK